MTSMAEQSLKDAKKDLYLMMHNAEEMLDLSEEAFVKNKTASLTKAQELGKDIHAKEDALTAMLAKLAPKDGEARKILSAPAHLEKIATSIERIVENFSMKIREGLLFSDKAMQETSTLVTAAKGMLKKAGEAVVTGSAAAASAANAASDEIIKKASSFATAHEDRLVTGECSPKSSSTYLCILYAFEDLAAHTREAVKKLTA
jgi:phosphate:Na+ symporter